MTTALFHPAFGYAEMKLLAKRLQRACDGSSVGDSVTVSRAELQALLGDYALVMKERDKLQRMQPWMGFIGDIEDAG